MKIIIIKNEIGIVEIVKMERQSFFVTFTMNAIKNRVLRRKKNILDDIEYKSRENIEK